MNPKNPKADQRIWFYVKKGFVSDETIGPLTNEEMNKAILRGEIKRKTRVDNGVNQNNFTQSPFGLGCLNESSIPPGTAEKRRTAEKRNSCYGCGPN